MKLLKHLILGALVGFFGSILILNIQTVDILKYADTIVIGLFIIVLILLGWGLLLHRKIKGLDDQELHGDEEDEVDTLKYRKFSDYSLFVQSSSVIALLALCMTAVTTMNMILIVIGIILAIVTYFLQASMINLIRIVHPERNIPKVSDPDYTKKLLETADDGEKYVMVHGFYKSYNLLNIVLVFAMIGSTIYSIATENSQLFSIVLMSIVLLMVNGRYLLTVRNK